MAIPSKLTIVNAVLNEIGRLAVVQINDSQDAQLISQKIDTLLPTLLDETDWNFAIEYRADTTPLLNNPFPEYLYAFQLPSNYGHMDRLVDMISDYRILDTYLLTNQDNVSYYFIVNDADYSVMPSIFRYTLALLVASEVCDVLTNNEELTMDLRAKYMAQLPKAILHNDMERRVAGAPYNDYDRVNLV